MVFCRSNLNRIRPHVTEEGVEEISGWATGPQLPSKWEAETRHVPRGRAAGDHSGLPFKQNSDQNNRNPLPLCIYILMGWERQ